MLLYLVSLNYTLRCPRPRPCTFNHINFKFRLLPFRFGRVTNVQSMTTQTLPFLPSGCPIAKPVALISFARVGSAISASNAHHTLDSRRLQVIVSDTSNDNSLAGSKPLSKWVIPKFKTSTPKSDTPKPSKNTVHLLSNRSR